MSHTKILVVEDDKIISLDIQRVLNAVGYDVPTSVSTGEDAIKFAKELLPDLILMDISLKGNMDGIHAASKIKKLKIPIIFLTAYKNQSLIDRAKETDPYGYILKPYDEHELKLTIDMALKKHAQITNMEGIIQETPLPLFFINNQHEVIFWNKAMEKLSGTPINEIIGTDKHWKSFYDKKRPCMADLLMDNKFQMIHELYSGKIDISEDSCSAEEYFPSVYNGVMLNFSASLIKNIQGKTIGALEIVDIK
jgi:CheY-like chemotaxis protein